MGEGEMTEQDWENHVKGFNKYEAIKLLAKGGMGAAFRVTSKKDFSDRALKLALGLDSEQYLEEETKIMWTLRHPHLVPIFEYGGLVNSSGLDYLLFLIFCLSMFINSMLNFWIECWFFVG